MVFTSPVESLTDSECRFRSGGGLYIRDRRFYGRAQRGFSNDDRKRACDHTSHRQFDGIIERAVSSFGPHATPNT